MHKTQGPSKGEIAVATCLGPIAFLPAVVGKFTYQKRVKFDWIGGKNWEVLRLLRHRRTKISWPGPLILMEMPLHCACTDWKGKD